MSRNLAVILTILVVVFSLSLIGCDVTAERELKRAETAIEEARDLNAEEHATKDYLDAEELLVEAAELARDDRIQEARHVAIRAKLRAEDAASKAQERMNILDEEMRELGR
ncbi:DUF4398 domain-containing protein [bacterium]|nr:DUF4398 domain-containing protein [bacterium]